MMKSPYRKPLSPTGQTFAKSTIEPELSVRGISLLCMATYPAEAMCTECNRPARVTVAKPVWSHGLDERSKWIVDVDCDNCGVQSGWLPGVDGK